LRLLTSAQEEAPSDRLAARFTWATLTLRTDSREYDVGLFSDTLNLQSDAGLPDHAPLPGLEAGLGSWRFALAATHLSSRKTLTVPLTFEEEVFAAGSTLKTTVRAAWLEAFYAVDVPADPSGTLDLKILLGLHAPKYKLILEEGGRDAREGHSALWPVPAVGGEARLSVAESIEVVGSLAATRVRYVNPFHSDGDSDPRVVYNFIRGRIELRWSFARSWDVSLGWTKFTHNLRDTSAEDRHRLWFDGDGLTFGVDHRF
jgi:hypothetical protein